MSHWGLGEGPNHDWGVGDIFDTVGDLFTGDPGGGGSTLPATTSQPSGGQAVTINLPPEGCGSYVFKKHCGTYRWVKRGRRRRKKLATVGDIRDLGALKSILGNGKAFSTWIATHS